MNATGRRVLKWLGVLALALTLSACANLNRKVEGVSLKPDARKEAVTAVALLFVSPDWDNKDPGLTQGYRLSGVLNPALIKRNGERAAEFMTANGMKTSYTGSYGTSYPIRNLMGEWAAKGYNTVLFVPVGTKVMSQSGTPLYGSVRYRITLYTRDFKPMLEMYDDFHAAGFNSNAPDTAAAGWLNALVDSGYLSKKTEKFVQPQFRDFAKEDRERKVSAP